MLPKINRNTKRDVDRIFKSGKFVVSPNLSFKFIFSEAKTAKVSFICPKSISKKATVRNKLRRRGYSAFKEQENLCPPGIHGVFIFGKNSLAVFGGAKNKKNDPFLNINDEIKAILHKIR